MPLLVRAFSILVQVTTVTNEPMRASERFAKKQAKPIDPSFIILDNRVKPLEFLSSSLPLTPRRGQEIHLISSIPHALEVFTTPTTTFEETLDQQKTPMLTSFQILSQVKPMEEANMNLLKEPSTN